MRRKVALVGSTPTKKDAPFGDDEFDIWAVSGAVYSRSLDGAHVEDTEDNGWNSVHRVDAFFEMHKREKWESRAKLLDMAGRPVYMLHHFPDVRSSVAYPIEEVALDCGDFFTCSISYMMALAIYQAYEEIHLYGIMMNHETEYAYQRPSVEYYMGLARGRGIRVVQGAATLGTSPYRYGYDDNDVMLAAIERLQMRHVEDIAKYSAALEDGRQRMNQHDGARRVLEDLKALIERGGVYGNQGV